MKLLVIALLIFGVVMIINGYLKQNMSCPPAVIKYKFLPRSPSEEMDSPLKVTDIFGKMFSEQSDQTI